MALSIPDSPTILKAMGRAYQQLSLSKAQTMSACCSQGTSACALNMTSSKEYDLGCMHR